MIKDFLTFTYPISQGIFLEIHCFILLLEISETVGFMSTVAQIIFYLYIFKLLKAIFQTN